MEVSPGEHQLANTVVNRERLLSLAAKILVAALFV